MALIDLMKEEVEMIVDALVEKRDRLDHAKEGFEQEHKNYDYVIERVRRANHE